MRGLSWPAIAWARSSVPPLSRYAVMPEARKVWQFAARPSSRARVSERQSGEPLSAAIPAAACGKSRSPSTQRNDVRSSRGFGVGWPCPLGIGGRGRVEGGPQHAQRHPVGIDRQRRVQVKAAGHGAGLVRADGPQVPASGRDGRSSGGCRPGCTAPSRARASGAACAPRTESGKRGRDKAVRGSGRS